MLNTRPRGRPLKFDRSAALDTAVQLFWRHGYEGTSIANLTDAMGATPPTLYAAFGSKDDLYREVLTRYVDKHARLRADVPAGSSAYEFTRSYLRGAAKDFADPTRPPGCMIFSGGLQSGPSRAVCLSAAAAMRSIAIDRFAERFVLAIERGELPAEVDAKALASFYIAVVQGMSAQSCDGAVADLLGGIVDVALSAWPGRRS